MSSSRIIFTNHNRESFLEMAFKECCRRIDSYKHQSYLWITTDYEFLRLIKKNLVDLSPQKVLTLFPIFTIDSFLNHIAEEIPRIPPRANRIILRMLLDEIISSSEDLKVLSKYRETYCPGLFDFILSFREAVLNSGLTFNREEPPFGLNVNLWADLRIVDEKINNELAKQGFIDPTIRDILILNNLDKKTFNSLFPDVEWVIFETPSEINNTSLLIFTKIFQFVPHIWLWLPFEKDSKVLEVFNSFFNSFNEQLKWEIKYKEKDCDESQVFFHLQKNLFQAIPEIDNSISREIDKRVKIYSCWNQIQELEFIALWIKKKLIEKGDNLKAGDIVISTPELPAYLPIIEESFRRFGIPFTLESTLQLIASPLVTSFLNLLKCIQNNYHKDYLKRVFDFPYFQRQLTLNEGDTTLSAKKVGTPDPDNFQISRSLIERLSLEARVEEDRGNWINNLTNLVEQIEHTIKIAEGDKNTITSDEEIDIGEKRKWLKIVQVSLGYLKDFFAHTQPLENSLSPEDFKYHLLSLLEFLRFPNFDFSAWGIDEICETNNINESEFRQNSIEVINRSYNHLISLIEQTIFAVSKMRNERHTIAFYYDLLFSQIKEARYRLSRKVSGGVKIVPLSLISSFPCKILFVAGLHIDAFPHSPGINPLFSYECNPLMFASTFMEEQTRLDRYLFFKFLTHPEKLTILTFPSRIEKETLPSPFIEELTTIYGLKIYSSSLEKPSKPMNLLSLIEDLAWNFDSYNQDSLKEYLKKNGMQIKHLNILNSAFRSTIVEEIRKSCETNSEFEGIISQENLKSEIHKRFMKHHFSISEIETYAQCPFKFFAQKILNLKEPEEIEEELTALEKGEYIHKVLFRFYSSLRDEVLGSSSPIETLKKGEYFSLKPTQGDFKDKLNRLITIALDEIKKFPHSSYFWKKQVESFIATQDENGYSGIFEIFLRNELEDKDKLQPFAFEVGFGRHLRKDVEDLLSDYEPIILDDREPPIRITGRIDRIDYSPDGSFMLIDYKTGARIPKTSDIEQSISFQLPLYIISADRILRKKLNKNTRQCSGAVYYRISSDKREAKKESYLFDSILQKTKILSCRNQSGSLPSRKINFTLDEFLERVKKRVRLIVNEICEARFSPFKPEISDPDKGFRIVKNELPVGCNYCSYKNICRRR